MKAPVPILGILRLRGQLGHDEVGAEARRRLDEAAARRRRARRARSATSTARWRTRPPCAGSTARGSRAATSTADSSTTAFHSRSSRWRAPPPPPSAPRLGVPRKALGAAGTRGTARPPSTRRRRRGPRPWCSAPTAEGAAPSSRARSHEWMRGDRSWLPSARSRRTSTPSSWCVAKKTSWSTPPSRMARRDLLSRRRTHEGRASRSRPSCGAPRVWRGAARSAHTSEAALPRNLARAALAAAAAAAACRRRRRALCSAHPPWPTTAGALARRCASTA